MFPDSAERNPGYEIMDAGAVDQPKHDRRYPTSAA
jgi:hypothetical protein